MSPAISIRGLVTCARCTTSSVTGVMLLQPIMPDLGQLLPVESQPRLLIVVPVSWAIQGRALLSLTIRQSLAGREFGPVVLAHLIQHPVRCRLASFHSQEPERRTGVLGWLARLGWQRQKALPALAVHQGGLAAPLRPASVALVVGWSHNARHLPAKKLSISGRSSSLSRRSIICVPPVRLAGIT